MSTPRKPVSRQGGTTLIVALLFLVLLTLLGTTSVMTTTSQERMAGNARNRDLAFQAAEHALQTADTWIKTSNLAALQGGLTAANDGIRRLEDRPSADRHRNDRDYWRGTFDWTTTDFCLANVSSPSACPAPSNLGQIAAQPRYFLEGMQDSAGHWYFRVTARGVGGTTDTVVILQTMYKFE